MARAVGLTNRDPGMLRLVAEMYYERGLGQQEIADITGNSVATISRMRKLAIESGIVTITVTHEEPDLPALSDQLSTALDTEVIVTAGFHSDARTESRMVGAAAAPVVRAMLPHSGIVGWSSGNTMDAVVSTLGPLSLPDVESVPLIGGWDNHQLHLDANALVRRFAAATGGRAHILHSPAFFPDKRTRDAMLAHPVVQETVRLWDTVTMGFTGSGMPPDLEANYFTITDRATQEQRDYLIEIGVVGDVLGSMFNIKGEMVDGMWETNMICPSLEQVQSIGRLVTIAGGHSKVRTIIGLGRSGLVDTIITDRHAAEGALEMLAQGV